MIQPSNKFLRLFQSDFFLGLILITVFLATNGYTYGWDDQHLEIPLLKHLIDSTLYQGDYYIEGLVNNFSSYFYPLLSKVISVDQIPTVYFILYLISRYFLFFWSYKLWRHVSRSRLQGFCAVLTFILILRVDEFLYRTFSHQEFTLAIIMAGIYFFFKERFILAGAILGMAANFHALYSLFPMIYMGTYQLIYIRRLGWKNLIGSSLAFIISCLPFIIWIVRNRTGDAYSGGGHPPASEWIPLLMLASPQNFILPPVPFAELISDLKKFFHLTHLYWMLILLFGINLAFNETFRRFRPAIASCGVAFALLIVSLLYTYIWPSRYVVDLNLIRNTQFLLFILTGFTAILMFQLSERHGVMVGLIVGVLFALLKYTPATAISAVIIILIVILILHINQIAISPIFKRCYQGLLGFIATLFVAIIYFEFMRPIYPMYIKIHLYVLLGLMLANSLFCLWIKHPRAKEISKQMFIIIPLMIFFSQYCQFHYRKVTVQRQGRTYFWHLQNSWEDMQRVAKQLTSKDAMIFIPHNMEMGGFRIGSERKVVVCYRDCGIIGFDYQAALEWKRRLDDVKEFDVTPSESPVQAIKNAIIKYGATHIVFLKPAAPPDNTLGLRQLYANDDFVLVEIKK